MKYCPYCGAQLAQIAVKCSACHTWLDVTKRPPWAKEVDDLWSSTFDMARASQMAGGPDAARLGEIGNRIYDYVAQQIERGAPPPWMWRDPSLVLKQSLAQAGLSAPQPMAQPVAPAPMPVAPAPMPVAPAPMPVAPAPMPMAQPAAPAPGAWQPPAGPSWQAPAAAPAAEERKRSETQPGGSRTFASEPAQPAAPGFAAPAQPAAPAFAAPAQPAAPAFAAPAQPAPPAFAAPAPVMPAAPTGPAADQAALAATMEAPPVGRWQPDDPNEPAHVPAQAHAAAHAHAGLMEAPGGPAGAGGAEVAFGEGPQGIPIDRLQAGKPTKPRRRSFTREFLGETFVEQAEMAEAAAAAGAAAGESGEFDSTFGDAVSTASSFPWKWVVIAVIAAGAVGGAVVFLT